MRSLTLTPNSDLDFVMTRFPRRFQEVLRKELALFIEVIAGALPIHDKHSNHQL